LKRSDSIILLILDGTKVIKIYGNVKYFIPILYFFSLLVKKICIFFLEASKF